MFFGRIAQIDLRDWASITDKLPSSDGRFEVTIKGCKGKRYVDMCNFNAISQSWQTDRNVIAWRERAKPYRD